MRELLEATYRHLRHIQKPEKTPHGEGVFVHDQSTGQSPVRAVQRRGVDGIVK